MNAVKADDLYVDPSALARLYVHQEGSREISLWRARIGGTLAVTHHGRVEVINAICRTAFLGCLDEDGMTEALADFDADFVQGRLWQADLLWRGALDRAGELSRSHTPKLGPRSLDVLHIACALELKLRHFLTFDDRQKNLARIAGLKTISIM